MLLSDVRFASLLAYSPNGLDERSAESRTWTYRLKDERVVGYPPRLASRFFAERLAAHVRDGRLPGVFGEVVVAVPMPGHAPRDPDSLWVPDCLCERMLELGLVGGSEHRLERITPVAKSRGAVRVAASQHLASMRATSPLRDVARILVVDDVITRGAVGLAAISLLRALLPNCDIRLFAMIRTISAPEDFREMLDPCSGVVALQPDGSTIRYP